MDLELMPPLNYLVTHPRSLSYLKTNMSSHLQVMYVSATCQIFIPFWTDGNHLQKEDLSVLFHQNFGLTCSRWYLAFKHWFQLNWKSIPRIKPAIINQDLVENHFCQIRACNGQNNNPTWRLQESAQNTVRYGQTTISRKSNAGLDGAKKTL